MQDLVWKIAGEQGQGLDSTSDIFATVSNRLGYHIYAYKVFSSRIKGGPTNFTVRVSTQPVLAAVPHVHVLVCMDQDSIDRLASELLPGGMILADSQFKPQVPAGVELVSVPMTEIARELGNPLFKNMVALGASAALLGMPLAGFKEYVVSKFGRKGQGVVEGNWAALDRGHDVAVQQAGSHAFHLDPGDGKARLILTGNDAAALGAVVAGCRVCAAYPITPASEILENCAKWLPKFGGVAVQAEDELSAIGMVVGAGFAGARAMTSTSGPGISLMQEYLGLASMCEIPLVVVDTQRGGPATGMPTKNEQSDVLSLIHGGHGEAPRIVLAPGTVPQIFADMQLAFNLADNYHCPVMVASDLALALWQQTAELNYTEPQIDRGPIADPVQLLKLAKETFERYADSATGVSPRSLPGQPNGQFLATGAEHGKLGKVTEDAHNRVKMMNRRLDKIKKLELGGQEVPGLIYKGPERPDVLLIGFGSAFGAVAEAADYMREDGRTVGTCQVRVLNPLPVEQLTALMAKAGRTFVVEQNATGQLAFLMKGHGIEARRMESILKYDGLLFSPQEIADKVRGAFSPKGVRV